MNLRPIGFTAGPEYPLGRGRLRREEEVEQTLLGVRRSLVLERLHHLVADHVHGHLDQLADHRLTVAAYVAHLGEF